MPGFGCKIADAVVASCSAYPFFARTIVKTGNQRFELIDGGYCANNPALYAVAEATAALGVPRSDLRVVSIGVGRYPQPHLRKFGKAWFINRLTSVRLLQMTLEVNTQSMEQLRSILFEDVPTVRINDVFEQPEMATDMFEHDMTKLNLLQRRGRDSYGKYETQLRELLLG